MTYRTDFNGIAELRTPTYWKNATGCNPCEVCGKEIKPGQGSLVRTEDGDYAIGSSCKRIVKAAGYEIVKDWRDA